MKYITLQNIYKRANYTTIKDVESIMLSNEEYSIFIKHLITIRNMKLHNNRQGVYFDGVHVIREDSVKKNQSFCDRIPSQDRQMLLDKLQEIIGYENQTA